MSSKLPFIPVIPNYQYIKDEMQKDFEYRMNERNDSTEFGRHLYYNINCQIIMTRECPYHCPFCLERQNPMKGIKNFDAQIEALKKVLKNHPTARVSVTGGEPSLYIEHVKKLYDTFCENGERKFFSVNTTLYSPDILKLDIPVINISSNDYVHPNIELFDDRCCLQTIFDNNTMTVENVKKAMDKYENVKSFSFRFLTEIGNDEYSVDVWNQLREDPEIEVGTFRIGDFFVYCTFRYKGKWARVCLGDMTRQTSVDYKDGYSNIIIHPDGKIVTNWK